MTVEKPLHFSWGLEGWVEAAETLWLQKKRSAIPVISRSPTGGKQQEMLTPLSHQSQGCCVPQGCCAPHPKAEEGLALVLQPEGSKGHQKSQEQHWLALLFFHSLSVPSLDVKIQAKIK